MSKRLYTIGYSGYNIDDFVDVLIRRGVNVLVDVRSSPYSSYFTMYNKEQLNAALNNKNIYYRNYATEFGAQQTEQRFYTPQGYLDFEKFTASDIYGGGYRKIEEGLKRGFVFAFMCSEKDPIDCHRSIMISKTFSDKGHEIIHLLPDNISLSQCDIEERLLNKYFPDRNQISIFAEQLNTDELIAEAYRKRNADIGHHTEGI